MNNSQLDSFLDNLQEDIYNDALRAYGKKGYARWLHPRFHGRMENADGKATLTGDCGDTISIWIKVDSETLRITEASYTTTGCASSSICGSYGAELAIGRSFEEVLDMSGQTILECLEKFPREEEHCAHLAITTVKEAINYYMQGNLHQKESL